MRAADQSKGQKEVKEDNKPEQDRTDEQRGFQERSPLDIT
jgi:hypothetical protein